MPRTSATYMSETYLDYQEGHFETMRDSDDVIVDAVERLLARSARPINQALVLDVGCSTGALLYHLRRNFAVMDLHGMDISAEAMRLRKTYSAR